jgi:hypothetical protein
MISMVIIVLSCKYVELKIRREDEDEERKIEDRISRACPHPQTVFCPHQPKEQTTTTAASRSSNSNKDASTRNERWMEWRE